MKAVQKVYPLIFVAPVGHAAVLSRRSRPALSAAWGVCGSRRAMLEKKVQLGGAYNFTSCHGIYYRRPCTDGN